MPDSDNTKKKFSPYLAPTEHDDEQKLVDEEETPTPEVSDEELVDDEGVEDEEGEVVVQQNPDEVEIEEEIVDEAIRTKEPPRQEPTGPKSWSYQTFGLLVLLLFCDVLVQRLGSHFFWTARSIYILSYVVRTTALLIAAYLWHHSLFKDNRATLRMVFLWLGLVSGSILAFLRFASGPSFWSFINMVVEPLDSMLLAFGVAFIVSELAIKLQTTKQTL